MASPIRAPMDSEPLGSIGGLLTPREDYIPNLQSVYGDIVQNAADYQYFTAPLSNQGRSTASYGTGNNLVVAPDTPVRLVNNTTGEVVYSGVGYAGAQGAIDAANALSSSTGKKANWDIQVSGPTMQGFQSVSTDRPDVSGLGILADVGLPILGSVLAGPLGAAAGSAASGAAQGRSIGDIAKGALISGVGSYLGGQLFQGAPAGATDAAISANVNNAINAAYQAAQSGAASSLGGIYGSAASGLAGGAGSLAGGALSSLPSNLAAIDAAAQSALSSAGLGGGVTGGLVTDAFGNVIDETGAIVASAGGGAGTSLLPAAAGATALGGAAALTGGGGASSASTTNQAASQTGENLSTDQFGNVVDETGAIVATGGGGAGGTAGILGGTAALGGGAALASGGGATDATISENVQNALDTATTNAQTGAANDLTAAGYNGMGAGAFVAPGAGAGVAGGILGTGLNLGQLAALGGLGASALGSLFGGGSGGGGAGAGTPYVSALGAMPNFASRTLVNPNITDYERYGFGPEALFFSGGQAINTYTPPAAPARTSAQGVLNAAAGAGTTAATSGALQPISATPTTTQPAMGVGPFPTSQVGGGVPSTPENTGMTQERLNQLQDRFENMRSGEFFNYFKSVNDVLGNYAAKGYITPEQGKEIQGRLEAAASVPGATLASLQAAVPMPQISDFLKPTGTQRPVAPTPAPMQPMTYTPPAQPITDPNRYINDLYKQLGAQVSQGKLSVEQARNIQSQLRQNLVSQSPNIQTMQNIYNTAIQQYRPLI